MTPTQRQLLQIKKEHLQLVSMIGLKAKTISAKALRVIFATRKIEDNAKRKLIALAAGVPEETINELIEL